MKFRYQKITAKKSEAFPERKFILRPVIPVILEHKDKKIGYWALIDSGADYNIFHAAVGEVLGLDIKSGKKEIFGGISAEKLTAYFYFINNFIVRFDLLKEEIELKPRRQIK